MSPARAKLSLIGLLCSCSVLASLSLPVAAQTAANAAGDNADGGQQNPRTYEDHYIDGGTLPPDISVGETSADQSGGLARALRVDAVAGVLTQDGPGGRTHVDQEGAIMSAQWDTRSWGAWSFDAAGGTPTAQNFSGITGSGTPSFALIQRGVPFDGGWHADNGVGDLNEPLIGLARQQPRFLLTSSPMLGVTTEWRGPSQLQIVAGGGEPGVFQGLVVPSFETLGGSTATLGAEWSPSPRWGLGAQAITTRDTNSLYGYSYGLPQQSVGAGSAPATFSSTTGYLTAAWQQDGEHAQLNFVDGSVDGTGNAMGVWLDATATQGFITHGAGLFRIEPNIAWGAQPMASDIEGGYYRLNYLSRRWLADAGVDVARSVSGNGTDVTFLTGGTRYQLTTSTGIGGTTNIRLGNGNTGWSVEGYIDDANSWGTGRSQLDYATDAQQQDVSAAFQQNWNLPTGARLATTVGVDRIHTTGAFGSVEDSTIARVAFYGGADVTARLSLDGNIQWAQAVQGHAAPSSSANVSLTWHMTRSWSALASYYESRVGSWTQLVITSPLTPPVPTALPSAGSSGFFLTIRYQDARGSHFAPLGGLPGSGSGRITGVVYLDANENGRFDAGETGAANVTVILDGRFSIRTDSNGRFDFPAVAAGHHVLTVQTDNLPLPWTLLNQGRTEVEVGTRDRTEANIGAMRLK
jgi:SdrD B-like domain